VKILFDQGVPKPLQAHLAGHDVHRAFQLGWADKKNGELLALAEQAGFDVLVTTDQNLLHQQNLRGRKMACLFSGAATGRRLSRMRKESRRKSIPSGSQASTFLRLSRAADSFHAFRK
jgi:hypothetical protein